MNCSPSKKKTGKDKYAADADAWVHWADHTYAGARELFRSDNPLLWFPASILGHHSLEMYLKAALIRKGHTVQMGDVWGHNLGELAGRLAQYIPALSSSIPDLGVFDDYFDELRYPQGLDQVEGLGEYEGNLLGALVSRLRPHGLR